MKKLIIILAICAVLVGASVMVAKPNKNLYDAKETGNRSFVNIVGDSGQLVSTNLQTITGWVQYSKKLPHLHTTWQIEGLEPNTEYQLKLHCKTIDTRLYVGPQWDGSILLWGNWGGESFLVMDIVTSDDDGHIGYGLDECRLIVGYYNDMQFIITKNAAPWFSAWTWENNDGDNSDFEITVATLMLYEKNPLDWNIVPPPEGAYAELSYDKAAPAFLVDIDAYGLEPDTNYKLIYYADPWPGTDGCSIADVGSDEFGEIHETGVGWDLNRHLPVPTDLNYPTGAKIWLVLANDYGCTEMTAWNPTEYLFENELITYFDTTIV